MEKDNKNRDLNLEAFIARESALRKRAATLSESPQPADGYLERLVVEERIRRDTEEEESKKR